MNIPTNSWEFVALIFGCVIGISVVIYAWMKIGMGLERRNSKQ